MGHGLVISAQGGVQAGWTGQDPHQRVFADPTFDRGCVRSAGGRCLSAWCRNAKNPVCVGPARVGAHHSTKKAIQLGAPGVRSSKATERAQPRPVDLRYRQVQAFGTDTAQPVPSVHRFGPP